MDQITQKARQLFKQWGRQGGKTRAKRLSPHKRSIIALNAARSRWREQKPSAILSFPSIRLEGARQNDPAYLEEILSDGIWKDWKEIYRIISDRPFGGTSVALEKVCSSVKIYGVTCLWKGLLRQI
ncbi:MAG: hypothetical protein HYU98_01280, partial [Deltaproteobacteria bacterium]|nr:hypothetical protein [Deltaproteobacteria bacterium]